MKINQGGGPSSWCLVAFGAPHILLQILTVFAFLQATSVVAAPADIRVITDDLTEVGKRNFEFQTTLARPPSGSGPSRGLVFQGLAELAYGLTDNWEVSGQLAISKLNGGWHANAINAELQYIAPHEDEGFYWGGRSEVGFGAPAGEKNTFQTELRPVLGYHLGRLHLVVNPALSWTLNGEDKSVRFEPSAKAAYLMAKNTSIGTEYFVEAGPIGNFLPRRSRSELAFLVLDTKLGQSNVTFGLGRRMTQASDRWVMKLVASFELD